MWTLIWAVAIMANPPQAIPYPEKFESKEQCETYGEEHRSRMEDWVRGNIRAPFEIPVRAVFQCAAEERPA
jgi:hypothetical protein